jgi:YD repeat-containing protein
MEYDGEGRMTRAINPLSAVEAFEYDEAGRLIKATAPNGEVTLYKYKNGLIEAVITGEDGDEIELSLEYDECHNLTKAAYPGGAAETREYDEEGNCVKAVGPLGAVTAMDYDKANRLVRVDSGDGNVTVLEYNAYTDVTRLKDNERDIRFTYGPLGDLTSRAERDRKIRMSYDTEGGLIRVENEAGEKYVFERDAEGRVATETGYDGVRKLYGYTPAGKLKGVKRGNTANWARMKYDGGGYLSKVIYDDGSDNPEAELFTHGLMGELLAAENKHAKLEFEYDVMGNVVKETQNGHAVESAYSQGHANARVGLKTGLGLNVDFGLNEFGPAENIAASFGDGNSPVTWKASQTFNPLGQLLERVTGVGSQAVPIKETWNYDKLGRPASHGVSIDKRESNDRRYTWDTGDKLKSVIDGIAKVGTEYSYDGFGNPQSEKHTGSKAQSTIRHLDETGRVYDTKSKIGRTYGKGGQLVKSKGRSYKYDDCGDLVEKREADGKVWNYFYHPSGLIMFV